MKRVLCVLLAACFVQTPDAAWSRTPPPEDELIQRAGNADSEPNGWRCWNNCEPFPNFLPRWRPTPTR